MNKLIILALTLSANLSLAAEDPFAGVEIKPTLVSGSVYMLEGRGGNIGLSIGVDGTLIVDDQFAQLGDRIQAAITELGGDKPKLILNTHFHGDHTGSNPQFGRTGTIVAHDNVRIRLASTDDFPREGLPVITYDDDATVHFNDDTIELIHLPKGHTDGDSAVWFKQSNVLHMGDHYFNGRFPYVDVPSGGSIDGYVANVRTAASAVPDDVAVIPGHGALSTKAELLNWISKVEASAQLVRDALDQNQDVTEIAAQLNKEYPGWGSGFIGSARWIAIVQQDAASK